jgi:cell wall-associated NlpC family hydrolase
MSVRVDPAALAAAAQCLIGAPWRLHGRDPDHGIDCIGLFAAAMARAGAPVVLPSGYPLRLTRIDAWLPDPGLLGFGAATGAAEPGDVLMICPGPAQFHLAIAAAGLPVSWIHAHAGLRRVVQTPALPAGPIHGHWRALPF